MIDDVVLVWMGEFGRTPRINQNVGRDHWARSWSNMIGGGGLNGGVAVGKTDADGVDVVGKSYLPGDIWATVSHALGNSDRYRPHVEAWSADETGERRHSDQRTDRLR